MLGTVKKAGSPRGQDTLNAGTVGCWGSSEIACEVSWRSMKVGLNALKKGNRATLAVVARVGRPPTPSKIPAVVEQQETTNLPTERRESVVYLRLEVAGVEENSA